MRGIEHVLKHPHLAEVLAAALRPYGLGHTDHKLILTRAIRASIRQSKPRVGREIHEDLHRAR